MTFSNITIILLVITLVITTYTVLIYPLLLILLHTFLKKPIKSDPLFEPNITIIVPIHNEESHILPLFESIKNSNYPFEKIQLIFGSDGSTDKSNEILSKLKEDYPNDLEVFYFHRIGKNKLLNELIEKAKNEIVVFIDADIRLTETTLKKLIAPFSDPTVGSTYSSIKTIKPNWEKPKLKANLLHAFGDLLKYLECGIHSTVNSNGPCYAIKKELLTQIPNDKVCDDFFFVLNVVFSGKRIIYLPEAIVWEVRNRKDINHLARTKRFVGGGISAILHFSINNFVRHPLIAFFLFSHKILRWSIPFFLLLSVIFILIEFPYNYFVSPSIIFFIAIIFLLVKLYKKKNKDIPFSIGIPYLVLSIIFGTVLGIFRALLGKKNAIWNPQKLEA